MHAMNWPFMASGPNIEMIGDIIIRNAIAYPEGTL